MRSYTPDQVAELEQVNRETVLGWIRSGELVAHSASASATSRKRRWRISETSLEAFRAARQRAEDRQRQQASRRTTKGGNHAG